MIPSLRLSGLDFAAEAVWRIVVSTLAKARCGAGLSFNAVPGGFDTNGAIASPS
jgi:hypothetical protein